MIGVAPPSLGSNSPVAAPAPAAPAPAPTAAFAAAPPVAAYEPPPAAPASSAQPVSSVNPLGGTMVADTSSFAAAFQPPAAAGGFDPNATAPAPAPGFGSSPPAAYGSAPPPAAMAPVAPAPMAPMEEESFAIPGAVGGPNPIVTVLLIVLTCGIYGIYLLIKGKKQNQA